MSFIKDSATGNGFIDYNDTTGPVTIIANTWTDIPNNGLGITPIQHIALLVLLN